LYFTLNGDDANNFAFIAFIKNIQSCAISHTLPEWCCSNVSMVELTVEAFEMQLPLSFLVLFPCKMNQLHSFYEKLQETTLLGRIENHEKNNKHEE
jgi:hypothetical protein